MERLYTDALPRSVVLDLGRDWLLERPKREGATDALQLVEEWLASGKPLTEADAEAMQARLQARKPPTIGGAQL